MEAIRGNPLYLHVHYLANDEQACCKANPTYANRLGQIQVLHHEVQQIRNMINRQLRLSAKEIEEHKEELERLELKLMGWDDELASLAEILLKKPKFRITDEVDLVDGRWHWVLPRRTAILPRHSARFPSEVLMQLPAASSLGKLSRRISTLLRTPSKIQKRFMRVKSIEPF